MFLSTLHLTSHTFPTTPCFKLKLKWLIILISYHPYPNSKTISNHLISYHPHPIWKTIFRLSCHHFLKNLFTHRYFCSPQFFKPVFYDFPRLISADGTPLPPSPLLPLKFLYFLDWVLVVTFILVKACAKSQHNPQIQNLLRNQLQWSYHWNQR